MRKRDRTSDEHRNATGRKTARRSARFAATVGLSSAILAVSSQISLPMPGGVPLTLQTFAVALCGNLLGSTGGTAAVAVWLTSGAVGLPVFSSFGSGIGVLFGITGGFLFGFLPLAWFSGKGSTRFRRILFGAVGLVACYAVSAGWASVLTGSDFFATAGGFVLFYAPKDVLSLIFADCLAIAIKRRGFSLF